MFSAAVLRILVATGSSVTDAEILVSRAREIRDADRCHAFSFNYECSVLVCYGSCALSIAQSVGGLASGTDTSLCMTRHQFVR